MGHRSLVWALSPSEPPNPTTKVGSKMGGEFTYQPKWDPRTVLTSTTLCHVCVKVLLVKVLSLGSVESASHPSPDPPNARESFDVRREK